MPATREQKKEVMRYLLGLIGLDDDTIVSVTDDLGFDDVTDFVSLEEDDFKTEEWKSKEAGVSAGQ